jgi:hypothetical protein
MRRKSMLGTNNLQFGTEWVTARDSTFNFNTGALHPATHKPFVLVNVWTFFQAKTIPIAFLNLFHVIVWLRIFVNPLLAEFQAVILKRLVGIQR